MVIMEQLTDKQLVILARRGDKKAMELLVTRYLKIIYNFSFRYVYNVADAEDIVQETFIKVWRNFKKFDESRQFKNWLYVIAKNTCLDFLKKKVAIPFSSFDTEIGNPIIDTLADHNILLEDEVDRSLLLTKLTAIKQRLSPKAAEALSLRLEGLTFRQISEKINEPLNTVKGRYRRTINQLKSLFSKK